MDVITREDVKRSRKQFPFYFWDDRDWNAIPINAQPKIDEVIDKSFNHPVDIETVVPAESGAITKTFLKILQWNVFSEAHMVQTRTKAILTEIRLANADVICLQEIRALHLAIILEDQFVRDNYCVSMNMDGFTKIIGVDKRCLMLVKKSWAAAGYLWRYSLTSQSRRSLWTFSLGGIYGAGLAIFTAQLDVGQDGEHSRKIQVRQIEEIRSEFHMKHAVIFAGDCSDDSEHSQFLYLRYNVDVWKSLNYEEPIESGWTRSPTNIMHTKYMSYYGFTSPTYTYTGNGRFDQCWLLIGSREVLKPLSAKIIGNEAIPFPENLEDEERVEQFGNILFPSDHFGLVTEFIMAPELQRLCPYFIGGTK